MNSLKAAEKFAKKNIAKGKRSKLDPHLEAIQFLLENDYTLLQVKEFLLKELKLSVSYSNLQGWVKRRFNNDSSTVKVSSGNLSQSQKSDNTSELDYSEFEGISQLYENMDKFKKRAKTSGLKMVESPVPKNDGELKKADKSKFV